MPTPITQAQPPLAFIPPAYNPIVYRLTRWLLPTWMHRNAQITDVEVHHPERLLDLYQQFQAGKIRLLIAFRHPSVNDPYCLFYTLAQALPRLARQQGVKLTRPTHVHFMYDRGIPLWAGKGVGWLYSKLGGTPIRRGKADLVGLRSARQLFLEGQFPMAAAPEGATNGHNEIVSPIEPGIAQLAFWCAEDLQKVGRSEKVMIVPLGIQYHYAAPPWNKIEALLTELEADSGLSVWEDATDALPDHLPISDQQQAILYQRLLRLGEHLLSLMEQFYSKYYHQDLQPVPGAEPTEIEAIAPENRAIAERLHRLLNTALGVAEAYYKISPKGTLAERCRRIEQAGWDRIYREDLKRLETLPPVERGLVDRIAEEADLRLWHMRLVESFVSVTGYYVIEKMTAERFAETVLLIWDVITRIKGDTNPFFRPQLAPQRAQVTVGEAIDISDRWTDYKANRRQAVASLTQDLQTALEQMIV